MNSWLLSRLAQAFRRLHVLPVGLAATLLAACGGGGEPTLYRSVAMTGEAIDYQVDTVDLTYEYRIADSASGLTGKIATGTLTANDDGSFTPSGAPMSRLVMLPNGIMLGAVKERFGDADATMPFIGLRDTATTTAALAARYNYVHRSCTSVGCDASYGTWQVAGNGAWSSCRGGDLSAGPCSGTAGAGTLEPSGPGEWRVRSDDGSDIGTAMGFDGAGQKLLVVRLKDARSGGFGSGLLIGGQQAPMTPAVSDGRYIAGMNTGTWFGFTASGSDVSITQLNFQSVDLDVTIAANTPWTGMTTTAWGEIGFISGAGLYLLMTPLGDLELGVKLR